MAWLPGAKITVITFHISLAKLLIKMFNISCLPQKLGKSIIIFCLSCEIIVFGVHVVLFDSLLNRCVFDSQFQILTAICKSFLMALLLPVPQYAMANVYIPDRRKTGSLSVVRLVTNGSASSKRAYIVNAIPTAKPRNIFSCCVSCAYFKFKRRKKQ